MRERGARSALQYRMREIVRTMLCYVAENSLPGMNRPTACGHSGDMTSYRCGFVTPVSLTLSCLIKEEANAIIN